MAIGPPAASGPAIPVAFGELLGDDALGQAGPVDELPPTPGDCQLAPLILCMGATRFDDYDGCHSDCHHPIGRDRGLRRWFN